MPKLETIYYKGNNKIEFYPMDLMRRFAGEMKIFFLPLQYNKLP